MKFSERLKKLIDEFKIDKKTLAKNTSISEKTIQSYLDDKTKPNINRLIVISRFFKKTVDYMVGLEDK